MRIIIYPAVILICGFAAKAQTRAYYRYEIVSRISEEGGLRVAVDNHTTKDVKIPGNNDLLEASVFGPFTGKNDFDRCSTTCLRSKLVRIQLLDIPIEHPQYIWRHFRKVLNHDSLNDLRMNHAEMFCKVKLTSSTGFNNYYIINPRDRTIRFLGSRDLDQKSELNLDEISLLPIGQEFYFFSIYKEKDDYLFDIRRITTGAENVIEFHPVRTPVSEIIKQITQ